MYCSEIHAHKDGGVCTSIHCPVFLAVSETENAFCSHVLETDPTLIMGAASQYMLFLFLSHLFTLTYWIFKEKKPR